MSRLLSLCAVLSGFLIACHGSDSSKPKIVGGTVAEPYPFFVGLFNVGDTSSFCGASLIETDVVLTAAHCVEDQATPLEVAIGLVENKKTEATQMRKVKAIKVHPDYDAKVFRNDIAILFLEAAEGDAQLLSSVIPLNRDATLPAIQTDVRVIGHGNMTSLGGFFDPKLYQVDVPVISTAVCQAFGGFYGSVDDTMLCAGDVKGGGKDSCQGDSGGPLFTKSSTPTLLGIVSFGDGCAQKEKPGVYTRVSSFVDWIDASIATYRNPPSPLDISRVNEQLEMYCYQSFVNYRSIFRENSTLSIEEMLTLPSEWNQAVKLQTIQEVLAMPNVKEIKRCEAQTLAGDAFKLLFIKEVSSEGALLGFKSYLETNGKLFEASRTPAFTDYNFSCYSPVEGESLYANYYQAEDYVNVSSSSFLFGKRISLAPEGLLQERSCNIDGYEAVLFKSAASEQYLRIQLPNQPELNWFKLEEDTSSAGLKLELTPINETQGFLEIINNSSTDMFTWNLSCSFGFSLKFGESTLTSKLNSSNVHEVVAIYPTDPNAGIKVGYSPSFVMTLSEKKMEDIKSLTCRLNEIPIPFTVRSL